MKYRPNFPISDHRRFNLVEKLDNILKKVEELRFPVHSFNSSSAQTHVHTNKQSIKILVSFLINLNYYYLLKIRVLLILNRVKFFILDFGRSEEYIGFFHSVILSNFWKQNLRLSGQEFSWNAVRYWGHFTDFPSHSLWKTD